MKYGIIPPKERANPLVIIALYTASGIMSFAIIAIIYTFWK